MQEIFIKYFSKIKRIFIYFDCRIHPEMDDYVNDGEEATGEAVKGAEEGTSPQAAGTAHKSTLG